MRCLLCGALIPRHPTESASRYAQRRFCCRSHVSTYRRQQRVVERLEDLTWLEETGEWPGHIPSRLGLNGKTLERWLIRNTKGVDVKHGTYAGYKVHKRAGEKPCEKCRQANCSYKAPRETRETREYVPIQHRVVNKLRFLSTDDAACRREPYLFTADHLSPDEVEIAKSICAGCPLQTACLQASLENKEESGIWGGLDGVERRRLLRQRAA